MNQKKLHRESMKKNVPLPPFFHQTFLEFIQETEFFCKKKKKLIYERTKKKEKVTGNKRIN